MNDQLLIAIILLGIVAAVVATWLGVPACLGPIAVVVVGIGLVRRRA